MGAKRIGIGILYTPNPNWVAGEYYVQNILSALRHCEDSRLPEVIVYCYDKAQYEQLRSVTKYPYLKPRFIKQSHSHLYYFLHYRVQQIFKISLPDADAYGYAYEKCAFIYPVTQLSYIADKSKVVGWIPDFQERYLPEFFPEKDIANREKQQRSYIQNKCPIVFSSYDSLNDWKRFYPEAVDIKTFVLHFSVTHPDFSHIEISILKKRFGISRDYMLCANQFWKHKNHLFLFKAYHIAKQKGFNKQLVCTGNLTDYRNPEYIKDIRNFITDYHLEKDILLLGFIGREEQLCLMKHSYALVQPSLFEGWSTVVEDAKCLNKFIFLSNLNVHKEQAPVNASFFSPHDVNDLATQFTDVTPTAFPSDYSECMQRSGEEFLHIIQSLTKP